MAAAAAARKSLGVSCLRRNLFSSLNPQHTFLKGLTTTTTETPHFTKQQRPPSNLGTHFSSSYISGYSGISIIKSQDELNNALSQAQGFKIGETKQTAKYGRADTSIHRLKRRSRISRINHPVPCVFYFTAVWCGPCRLVGPMVEALSKKYPHVKIYKIDVDQKELMRTLTDWGIGTVPTFRFFREGKKLREMTGADVPLLAQTMEDLYKYSDSS